MSRLLSTATAHPGIDATQAQVFAEVDRWLEARGRETSRIRRVFENSGVERRQSVQPLDELFRPRRFGERNAAYTEAAIALAETAARRALEAAEVEPGEIGLVTSVSCTGFLIPSIDAHLANRLPLRHDIRRLPLTLLGCAGGAMGLSHTVDLLAARPRELALLVAVELSSQNFQAEDLSMAHLVSCALFGDGAGAVVLAGDASPRARDGDAPRPTVVASRTRFFHDTLDAMGFDVRDSGFHMVLDPRIPSFLDETIWPEIERFLVDQGLDPREGGPEHWLVHPGGRAILDVLEARIGRGPAAVDVSRRVLRQHGNLSSASILAVLDEFDRTVEPRAGDRGVLVAFGPGFNAELVLLEWRD